MLLAVALVALGVVVPFRPAAAAATFEERMLQLINDARATNGVAPLQLAPDVARVAADGPYQGCGYTVSGRSTDMGVRNYFSHTVLNCGAQGYTDMLRAAGISVSASAENIAWASGYTDPVIAAERLHNDLMASPTHRDNLLNPNFTHVGIGSWHAATGESWSGGGTPLRNVFLTTEIFARLPVTAGTSGGRYHAVTPSRILDTRTGPGPLAGGTTMALQVTGVGGVPASGVSAVVVNVTVTNPTAPSFLTVFPAGEALPTAANLNFTAGQTVPNLVTAKVGRGGSLSIFNAAGATDVVADVAGWYDQGGSTGGRYHPLSPARLFDTRSGTGALGSGATMDVQVTGQAGVPAAGVSAVVLNVTVTSTTAPSFLTVYPAGEPRPWAANLNYIAGQTVGNLVTAKLGSGGRLSIYNAAGSTDVIGDVAGWYDDGASTTGSAYHPVSPARVLDTRSAGGPITAGTTRDLQVAGQAGVPASGASAVIVNVAVTNTTAMSYLTVFPAGDARPFASSINFLPGQTVANLVIAKLGAQGRLSIFNAAGSTDVIGDVAGWFDGA